jgi:hypothetical protein
MARIFCAICKQRGELAPGRIQDFDGDVPGRWAAVILSAAKDLGHLAFQCEIAE